ncbi:MAG: histidinol-phosphate phosphatase family protein [Candidatus Magasanikbacteria bacterium GW2011_GWA2_56_11]|uniref:D,D-heptose 1,7-bisphosphate phosphatase n=1 Tax=Candidatus Magasanikbacteria bacterium GW2011_GWA2_56_11 TaxID=1619044 RepID=A0A0G1YFZ2_9BACT|nr:MAG: histidinol-phosphate phosphatase family protein [Candidatus Magasanikbacteria bacterium GW2011_GWA2_56_11]
MARRAVFIDRDGVINETVDRGQEFYVAGKLARRTAPFTYEEFNLKPRVAETLRRLGELGWTRILATNQPDITYGTMKLAAHERIMAAVQALPLDDIFVCTHGRADDCQCKKPRPGMLQAAAAKWKIDFSRSYLVGDTQADLGAARAVGVPCVLIDYEYNRELDPEFRIPDFASLPLFIK